LESVERLPTASAAELGLFLLLLVAARSSYDPPQQRLPLSLLLGLRQRKEGRGRQSFGRAEKRVSGQEALTGSVNGCRRILTFFAEAMFLLAPVPQLAAGAAASFRKRTRRRVFKITPQWVSMPCAWFGRSVV
jgi:hypothetical protein